MKSDQSTKHSLNRMEKVPIDHPIPVPFDYSVHMQISSLSFIALYRKNSGNLFYAAFKLKNESIFFFFRKACVL